MTLITIKNNSLYKPVRNMNIGQPFIGKLTGHTFLLISHIGEWLSYYDFNDNAVKSCHEYSDPEGMPVSIVSMEIE